MTVFLPEGPKIVKFQTKTRRTHLGEIPEFTRRCLKRARKVDSSLTFEDHAQQGLSLYFEDSKLMMMSRLPDPLVEPFIQVCGQMNLIVQSNDKSWFNNRNIVVGLAGREDSMADIVKTVLTEIWHVDPKDCISAVERD